MPRRGTPEAGRFSGAAYEAGMSKDGSAVRYAIEVAGGGKDHTVKVGPDGTVAN